jgi:hypothetical protein
VLLVVDRVDFADLKLPSVTAYPAISLSASVRENYLTLVTSDDVLHS